MDDPMIESIVLRDVVEDDMAIFFTQQLDPTANHMAAFVAKDPTDWDAFTAHWARNLAQDTITVRTILFNGAVTGHVACFPQFDNLDVAYWLGKEYWGRGIATAALALFLREIPTRPLHACVVKDNLASLRVLQKCGFVIAGEDKGFSHARDQEVEEFILVLAATPEPAP